MLLFPSQRVGMTSVPAFPDLAAAGAECPKEFLRLRKLFKLSQNRSSDLQPIYLPGSEALHRPPFPMPHPEAVHQGGCQ